MVIQIRDEIKRLANVGKAKHLQQFFKTGKGQYGEGDVFLGLTVPQSRKIAKQFSDLSIADIEKLLQSKFHEERLIALLLLVDQFRKGDEKMRKEIFEFYLAHTRWITNWDLVDTSADKIVGEYLYCVCHSERNGVESRDLYHKATQLKRSLHLSLDGKDIKILYALARSENLWERRIAMIATFAFILHGESAETLRIADILLHDKYDLIQKAVGWMLREVGKRCSEDIEKEFLRTRYKTMPRTALRYAIERFSVEERKAYLAGKI